MFSENKKKKIFYTSVGVMTLMISVIGATFAYFTATRDNNNVIKGTASTIGFELLVSRDETMDITNGGLIPMSSSMIQAAVSNSTPCVDNNGNSVCQIYKITVNNNSTSSIFLDGYVGLANATGGPLGTPTDVVYSNPGAATTMRWAQVFKNGSTYTTVGKTTTTATTGTTTIPGFANSNSSWSNIGMTSAQETSAGVAASAKGKNLTNIYGGTNGLVTSVTNTGTIKSNSYVIINRNYIRISDHNSSSAYNRTNDISSALVFNQYLDAASGSITTDSVVMYIVVWLAETGTNQTANQGSNGTGLAFFKGNVVFQSSEGAKISATFSNYASPQA